MIAWGLALLLGLAAAWIGYGAWIADRQLRRQALLLGTLRTVAVALTAALLLAAPLAAPRQADPLVAIDVSASWRRAAGEESSAVRAIRTQWTRAAQAGNVPLVLFGDSLREATPSSLAQLVPQDAASRVRGAVDRAAALGRPLTLVTDGFLDDPEALTDAPPGSRAVVVDAVARADAALADLTVPASAQAGDTVSLAAVIAAGAAGAPAGRLQLSLDGQLLGQTAVPPLGPDGTTRVTLPLIVPRGAHTAIAQATLQLAGDLEPRNDTLSAALTITDRPAAVLISTAPDLDVREMLTVLRGALAVPTRAFFRLAPGVWREEGRYSAVSEEAVRAQAAAAGLLLVHGDTSWVPRDAAARKGALALWTPAPVTPIAAAGELPKSSEWYVIGAPLSPLSAALAGIPWDSLPPISLAGPAGGTMPLLTALLARQGQAQPVIAAQEIGRARRLVVSGSGFAGWSLRGGRSGDAFGALWGAMFDWLAAGQGDARAARPATAWVRAGEAVRWRRGGSDSTVLVTLTRRARNAAAARTPTAGAADSLVLHFPAGAMDAVSAPQAPGVYDVRTAGGSAVLVVNPSREWVPRAPTVRSGLLRAGSVTGVAPRLQEAWWPYVVALLLLCGEWLARRRLGLR